MVTVAMGAHDVTDEPVRTWRLYRTSTGPTVVCAQDHPSLDPERFIDSREFARADDAHRALADLDALGVLAGDHADGDRGEAAALGAVEQALRFLDFAGNTEPVARVRFHLEAARAELGGLAR